MTARRAIRRSAAILLVALLGACGASSGASETTRAARPLVTFARTGGLAGVRDTLRVSVAGRVAVTRRPASSPTRFTRLGPRRLGALRRALRRARLPRRARYPGPPGSADLFHYVIATPGHRVEAGGLGRAPARVRRLIARLTALLEA
jgi:hypothetical protein